MKKNALMKVVFLLLPFSLITFSAQAEVGKDVLRACKILGGTYEETKTGCDPDCIEAYRCVFDQGAGRECDAKGECKSLDLRAQSLPAATTRSTTNQADLDDLRRRRLRR